MAEEQEALTTNAGSFIDTLTANDIEFRLGITTTDRLDGSLVGDFVDETTPQISTAFAGLVAGAGISGSRDEMGLTAAVMAGDPSLNPDFARAQADLELIVYSDEDDQSAESVSDLVKQMQAARSGFTVRVHTIVGDAPDGCASATGAADPGLRYLEARESTDGARESICAHDTAELLARMAHHVLGLETEFPLQELPLLNTLVVTVDGVEIPRRDTDGWRYDGADNAVIFDGWAIPQPGATIEMRYFNYTGGPLPDTGGDTSATTSE
jgi:hypothetical protein